MYVFFESHNITWNHLKSFDIYFQKIWFCFSLIYKLEKSKLSKRKYREKILNQYAKEQILEGLVFGYSLENSLLELEKDSIELKDRELKDRIKN